MFDIDGLAEWLSKKVDSFRENRGPESAIEVYMAAQRIILFLAVFHEDVHLEGVVNLDYGKAWASITHTVGEGWMFGIREEGAKPSKELNAFCCVCDGTKPSFADELAFNRRCLQVAGDILEKVEQLDLERRESQMLDDTEEARRNAAEAYLGSILKPETTRLMQEKGVRAKPLVIVSPDETCLEIALRKGSRCLQRYTVEVRSRSYSEMARGAGPHEANYSLNQFAYVLNGKIQYMLDKK